MIPVIQSFKKIKMSQTFRKIWGKKYLLHEINSTNHNNYRHILDEIEYNAPIKYTWWLTNTRKFTIEKKIKGFYFKIILQMRGDEIISKGLIKHIPYYYKHECATLEELLEELQEELQFDQIEGSVLKWYNTGRIIDLTKFQDINVEDLIITAIVADSIESEVTVTGTTLDKIREILYNTPLPKNITDYVIPQKLDRFNDYHDRFYENKQNITFKDFYNSTEEKYNGKYDWRSVLESIIYMSHFNVDNRKIRNCYLELLCD